MVVFESAVEGTEDVECDGDRGGFGDETIARREMASARDGTGDCDVDVWRWETERELEAREDDDRLVMTGVLSFPCMRT